MKTYDLSRLDQFTRSNQYYFKAGPDSALTERVELHINGKLHTTWKCRGGTAIHVLWNLRDHFQTDNDGNYQGEDCGPDGWAAFGFRKASGGAMYSHASMFQGNDDLLRRRNLNPL